MYFFKTVIQVDSVYPFFLFNNITTRIIEIMCYETKIVLNYFLINWYTIQQIGRVEISFQITTISISFVKW